MFFLRRVLLRLARIVLYDMLDEDVLQAGNGGHGLGGAMQNQIDFTEGLIGFRQGCCEDEDIDPLSIHSF